MEEEEKSPNTETELFSAVVKGDEELVKVLLLENKHLDINFQFKNRVFQNSLSFFSLFYFLFFSFLFSFSLSLFSFSLSFMLLLFLFVKAGKAALHKAAEKGFEGIVKILLEHGSNVHLQTRVFSFLILFFSLSFSLSSDFLFSFFLFFFFLFFISLLSLSFFFPAVLSLSPFIFICCCCCVKS